MSLSPPYNFTDDTSAVERLGFTAVTPLAFNAYDQTLAVGIATDTGSGVVTTSEQTFAGTKHFTSAPTSITPTEANHVTTKAYVDDLVKGVTWKHPVRAFWDYSSGNPSNLVDEDQYISMTNYNGFTKDNIYTYHDATNSTWVEETPTEGYACRVTNDTGTYANQAIVYNGSEWVSFATGVDHDSLIGVPAGSKTHAQINNHIDTAVTHFASTTAHSGQALSTTSSPTFASVTVTDLLSKTRTAMTATTMTYSAGATMFNLARENQYELIYLTGTANPINVLQLEDPVAIPSGYTHVLINKTTDIITVKTNGAVTLFILYAAGTCGSSMRVRWSGTAWDNVSEGVSPTSYLTNTAAFRIPYTTPANSATDAALVVPGGIGSSGNYYTNGRVIVSNTSGSTAPTSASAIATSGGISSSLATDATDATNGGCATLAGGLAVGKKLYVGTSITSGGPISAAVTTNTGLSALNSTLAAGSNVLAAVGKAASANNCAVLKYTADASNPYASFGLWGSDAVFKAYASGVTATRVNLAATYRLDMTGGNSYTCVVGTTNQVLYVTGTGDNSITLFDKATIPSVWNQTILNKTSGTLTVYNNPEATIIYYIAPGGGLALYWDGSNWLDMAGGLSATSGGVIWNQTAASSATSAALILKGGMAAVKDCYFSANALCPTAPSAGNHLCNKTYVDGAMRNQTTFDINVGAGTGNMTALTATSAPIQIHNVNGSGASSIITLPDSPSAGMRFEVFASGVLPITVRTSTLSQTFSVAAGYRSVFTYCGVTAKWMAVTGAFTV